MMKKQMVFSKKRCICDILIPMIIFFLLYLLQEPFQKATDFFAPNYSIPLVYFLYLLLGVYLKRENIFSLCKPGTLVIEVHCLIISILLLLILFSYPWPLATVFPQLLDSSIAQTFYRLCFPIYSSVGQDIIIVLLGYFLASICKKSMIE